MLEEFVKVAEVTELAPGQMKMVEWGEDQVLLINLDGSFYAWCSSQ
jgi:nitrite reductase/ring-hydroxylating ferredoxin subunit